jgi:hypothetical protein
MVTARRSAVQPTLRLGLAALLTAVIIGTPASALGATPFTTLQPPFTQELYATSPNFGLLGGIAFAPNGDVLAADCFNGAQSRFSLSGHVTVNGSSVHPETQLTPLGTCGLANGPSGAIYSNGPDGVRRIDPNTGNVMATGGLPGNGFGIANDP